MTDEKLKRAKELEYEIKVFKRLFNAFDQLRTNIFIRKKTIFRANFTDDINTNEVREVDKVFFEKWTEANRDMIEARIKELKSELEEL